MKILNAFSPILFEFGLTGMFMNFRSQYFVVCYNIYDFYLRYIRDQINNNT